MDEYDADQPWQAFVQVRLGYYEALLEDPATIRENRWPHTMGLLQTARQNHCAVALATTSRRDQADRVLDARWIADDPAQLPSTVQMMLDEQEDA